MSDAVEIYVDFHEDIDISSYDKDIIAKTIQCALAFMNDKLQDGMEFAYFSDAAQYWHKAKTLDIYITSNDEGRQLNLDARGKDYATNILSYPSDLPNDVLHLMDDIPLGELIICHDVVLRESAEQNKSFTHHLQHLLVHGVLHLLGFDHEISDKDADEMENLEINILQNLAIDNPYRQI